MITVDFPRLTAAQEASWLALIEVGQQLQDGWTLVGGQLVHLHCIERGASPTRPTDDGDAALDVRAEPDILRKYTGILVEIGFVADKPTWRGHQHRWRRGDAVIDVLIPRFLGERGESRTGVTGSTTIAAPGVQGALDRTELVQVTVAGITGVIPRPTLVGAITGKAAALEIPDDPAWKRHVQDLAVLSTLMGRNDNFGSCNRMEIDRIRNAIGRAAVDPGIVAGIEGATGGLERLKLALERADSR